MPPTIYVDRSTYPDLGAYRVVAVIGGNVGSLYLHYGTREECVAVAAFVEGLGSPYRLHGLLQSIGRPELAEQVRIEG